MSSLDAKSAELCNSITRRLEQFARRVGSGNTTPDKYKGLLVAHQPRDGVWNSPCSGPHDSPVRWPCRDVVALDRADTYPTNGSAARIGDI
jgi:hypothetical protein